MPSKLLSFGIIFFILFLLSCKEDVVDPIFFGEITGIVQDSESGDPLGNTIITTNPTTSSITTDSQGKFIIIDIETGEYAISAEKEGYSKKTITVNVDKNRNTNATILLSKRSGSESNTPPTKAVIISPENNSADQPNDLTLSWYSNDEDQDTLFYDVYLFSSQNSEKIQIGNNITDTTLFVADLKYSTTYFWQVIVSDGINESVNGEVWSFTTEEFPDYPTIFTSNVSGNFEIYSASLDTSNKVIKLTDTQSNELWPRFNPVRDVIAFTNDKDIDRHIYTMKVDGTYVYKVTQVPVEGNHNNGIGFCWSPDGNEIYYSNYSKLYRVNSNGSNLTEIALAPENRNFREVDVSSAGDKIAVLTIGQNFYDSEIYVINIDGGGMIKLVDNLPGAVQSPVFTIDGKSIVYSHDASEHISSTNRQLDSRIYIISIDSLEVQDLSTGKSAGTNDLNPRISPNGANIIFENVSNDNSSEGEIMIMDITGTNRRSTNVNGRMPDWK